MFAGFIYPKIKREEILAGNICSPKEVCCDSSMKWLHLLETEWFYTKVADFHSSLYETGNSNMEYL